MRVVILGFEGCLPSGMTGLVDMFWLAAQAAERITPATRLDGERWQPCDVLTASPDGRPLRDGHGRLLPVDVAATEVAACEAILIPGLVPGCDGLPPRTPALRETGRWLHAQHAAGALVAASCAGVLLLGEAGLLDDRRCTTTWWLQDELRQRCPLARISPGSALLADDRVVTAGGPLSWIDLALHVIATLSGPDAARLAADFAVIGNTPLLQASYAPRGFVSARDPFLLEAERIVRQGDPGLGASGLAARLATCERTLHRRLKTLISESPRSFIARIRLETARALLDSDAGSIKRVAAQAGYRDESSFRRAFARMAGMTPSAYRRWARERAMQRAPSRPPEDDGS